MELTIEQAREIVSTIPGEFAQSLVSRRYLSEKQEFWLFKLAADKINPPTPTNIQLDANIGEAVSKVLANGSQHLKYPKIRVAIDGDHKIALKPRDGGVTYIVDNDRTRWDEQRGEVPVYYGKIINNEIIAPRSGCPDWVVQAINNFGADPVGQATLYGKITNTCCFCGRILSQKDSVERGYGPICANKYGL